MPPCVNCLAKVNNEPAVYIGTSGWSYRHWRDCFYQGVARADWLKFYAEQFLAVEINSTFYRLQRPQTFNKWFAATPATFRFSLKANHYLTHNKKLLDPDVAVGNEKNHATALKEKLAVVLWQLPRQLRKDKPRLQAFIDALQEWREVRHTVEFRHASWFEEDVADMLREAGIAACQSDAANWPLWRCVTTNLVYIRLHGHSRTYASSYSVNELAQWADQIIEWFKQGRDVHVYFDNDAECAAPFNALTLRGLIEKRINQMQASQRI
jgi:uncharacterized protein YecE (DUF72 family)